MNKIPEFFHKSKKIPSSLAYYPGGKGMYAQRIIDILPKGVRYLEPYCGMANVFARIKDFQIVALNDIDKIIVNIFRVLQNDNLYDKLMNRLIYTLYSQEEFKLAIDVLRKPDEHDEIEKAWAFFVTQNQGFAGIAKTYGYWGRRLDKQSIPLPITWQQKIANIHWWHEKLFNVYLDNRDAIDFIKFWDHEDGESVFYIDPPYMTNTAVSKEIYGNETDNVHHTNLVTTLCSLKGKGVLSCYDDETYYPLLEHGWRKETFATTTMMGRRIRKSVVKNEKTVGKRIETMYIKGE